VLRINGEEKMLIDELVGYLEYRERLSIAYCQGYGRDKNKVRLRVCKKCHIVWTSK